MYSTMGEPQSDVSKLAKLRKSEAVLILRLVIYMILIGSDYLAKVITPPPA